MLNNQKARLSRHRQSSLLSKKKTGHRLSVERLEERMLLAVRVWDGGGSNALWSNAENWVGDLAPQADDNLVFGSGVSGADLTAQNDFADNTRFRSITISGDGYYLTGTHSVALLEGLLANNASGTSTVEFDILIGASQSIVAASSGTTLILNGTIHTGDTVGSSLQLAFDGHGTVQVNGAITGQGTVARNDGGSLVLAGDNTYTGFTYLYGGVVTDLYSRLFRGPVAGRRQRPGHCRNIDVVQLRQQRLGR
jgi:autotransporter-associated beta strand protein